MKNLNKPLTWIIFGAMLILQSSKMKAQYCTDMPQWPMVYMPASTFQCSDYSVSFMDDFLDQNGNPYAGQPDTDVWELFDGPDADNVLQHIIYSPPQFVATLLIM